MKKTSILKRPDTGHYSNPNHVEFHKMESGVCVKYASEIGSPTLISSYEAAVLTESSIFKWIRHSEFTEKKIKADHKRDNAYLGVTGTVRVNLRHFDPQVQDAAVHLDNLLTGYGDVTNMGYDAETANIDSVIDRLRSGGYAPSVQLLGLTPWINHLEVANNEFKEYVDDATQEKIDRPEISLKDARRLSDNALGLIIERVEAKVALDGEANFVSFIEEFNAQVQHYNTQVHEHYGRLHARKDIGTAVIEPIALQKFTGDPVFVIPEVSLRDVAPDGSEKITKLVFSVDFNLTFKNNIQPGTASLAIHGIGRYKGEFLTTFNIIKE